MMLFCFIHCDFKLHKLLLFSWLWPKSKRSSESAASHQLCFYEFYELVFW